MRIIIDVNQATVKSTTRQVSFAHFMDSIASWLRNFEFLNEQQTFKNTLEKIDHVGKFNQWMIKTSPSLVHEKAQQHSWYFYLRFSFLMLDYSSRRSMILGNNFKKEDPSKYNIMKFILLNHM